MKAGLFFANLLLISTLDIIYADTFIDTVEGYVRSGVQLTDIKHDDTYTDIALGGKLHIDTKAFYGINAAASLYTTNALGKQEGNGIPFFDADNHSYTILGEAYLKGKWENTALTVGRQEIDTPFADTDDIGMIPNTFEAAMLVSQITEDTTMTLGHLHKMAGVDAPNPSEFTRINDDQGVQLLGVSYEGISNLVLSAWDYRLNRYETDNIAYFEANYENKYNDLTYGFNLQYALQNAQMPGADNADIYGIDASVGFENTGLALGLAYNKSEGNAANNGFGGGPFFTSSEHLTLAEANGEGEAFFYTLNWDAKSIGLENLSFQIGKFILEDDSGIQSDEIDFAASYSFSDALSIEAYVSHIDDAINAAKCKNTRVFLNYTF
ncbi:MAG: OprD family outer membrane porin [Sulfurovum sp.]|nr:OprD family outer membrane porin [Sulfurovum sp.]MDD3603163.1 OprD family outer membrane porin [Sulfurovum sp.]